MGTQVRDEGSLFDSTVDTLGVGSTSQCHFSIMQDRPMIQFPRLVEETEGKDSEPDHAGICPVMSQVDSQRSHSEYHDVIDSRRLMKRLFDSRGGM